MVTSIHTMDHLQMSTSILSYQILTTLSTLAILQNSASLKFNTQILCLPRNKCLDVVNNVRNLFDFSPMCNLL